MFYQISLQSDQLILHMELPNDFPPAFKILVDAAEAHVGSIFDSLEVA